ncbi:MAG: DNA translocase FtsK 4TM domain-containing protein [Planctomyces sp.]
MFDSDRLKTDLLALGLLALVVFSGLSLLSFDPADPPSTIVFPVRATPVNICGNAGAALAFHGGQLLGAGIWIVLLTLAAWDLKLFAREPSRGTAPVLTGLVMLVASGCVLLQLIMPDLSTGSLYGSGGQVGALLGLLLTQLFSPVGILILCGSLFAAGLVLTPLSDLLLPVVKMGLLPATLAGSSLRRISRGFGRTPAAPAERRMPADAPATVPLPPAAAPDTATSEANAAATAVTAAPAKPRGRRAAEKTDKSVKTSVSGDSPVTADEEPATLPFRRPATAVAESDRDADQDADSDDELPLPKVAVLPASSRNIRINAPVTMKAPAAGNAKTERPGYSLPAVDLLAEGEEFPYEQLAKKARLAANTLEQAFAEFGLNVRVSEIDTGPVVTQFELELEKGLRLSKVTALEDDLAIALRVPAVRVVAPIPGKNTVGVEVPNEKQVMVRLRELLQSTGVGCESLRLPLFLGKDVSGRPLAVDLAKMPHLLIAGRTGTGKSVCLNTLIISLLMTRTPDEVRMLMIDPKMVELSPYKRIPHLMHPVITDMKKAEAVLAWAVDTMEERYDLLARVGVRHLDSFNKLGRAEILERLGAGENDPESAAIPERLPFIVIIADEMADLMMTSGKEVESYIIRLAQKSRAVGIHLVLATQKPTVDVITGLIKSNLPARIAFQVASKTDSRVVLDESGAERLLGSGDMLYLAPGTSHVTRAQGTWVSDDEINAVIDYFNDTAPEFNADLLRLTAQAGQASGGASTDPADRPHDDLYDSAVEVVIREGRGSVSLLQRALGIGYGRAARMIDWMAADGVVGDYNGQHAREVICTMEQWQSARADRD